MFWLILYLVSVLLNFFVFLPLVFKYVDRTRMNMADVNFNVFVSFFSLIVPIVLTSVILWRKYSFNIMATLTDSLNKFWRIK